MDSLVCGSHGLAPLRGEQDAESGGRSPHLWSLSVDAEATPPQGCPSQWKSSVSITLSLAILADSSGPRSSRRSAPKSDALFSPNPLPASLISQVSALQPSSVTLSTLPSYHSLVKPPKLRSPVCLTSWMQLKFYLSWNHKESVTVKSSSDLSCVYLRLHGWVMGGFFGGSHSSSNHEAWFFIFQLRSFRHPLRVSILMHPLSRSSSDSPLRTLRGCAACPLRQACTSAPVILINWLP